MAADSMDNEQNWSPKKSYIIWKNNIPKTIPERLSFKTVGPETWMLDN